MLYKSLVLIIPIQLAHLFCEICWNFGFLSDHFGITSVCFRFRNEMSRCLMSLVWFLLLITVSFIIAFIALHFYIIVIPFTVCIPCCDHIANFLLACIQFPRKCVEGICDGNCFWE